MAVNGRNQMRDFMSLRDAMDRFLDDRWVSPGSWLTWTGYGTQYLPLDAYETADDVVVRALVPGVAADAIDVQYQQGTLTIRTTTSEAELPRGGAWLLHEVAAGQSIRQVTLPPKVDVERVESTLEDGVLTLRLPKSADAKPKRIDVGSTPRVGAGSH